MVSNCIAGNAQYIKYLTVPRALWFLLNAPFRSRRFFDAEGQPAAVMLRLTPSASCI